MVCFEGSLFPIFAILGLIGIIGHFMIIWTYMKKAILHTNCHLILVNLSASDLLMAVALFPIAAAAYSTDETACDSIRHATSVIMYIAFTSKVISVAYLNLDRYWAGFHGYTYNSGISKYTVRVIAISWLLVAFVSGLCLIEQPSARPTFFIRARKAQDGFFVTAALSGLAVIAFCQVELFRQSRAIL